MVVSADYRACVHVYLLSSSVSCGTVDSRPSPFKMNSPDDRATIAQIRRVWMNSINILIKRHKILRKVQNGHGNE